MRTHFDHSLRQRSQRLADLQNKTAELERQLIDARVSLERELAESADSWEATPDQIQETYRCPPAEMSRDDDRDGISDPYAAAGSAHGYDSANSGGQVYSFEGRTEVLVNHGRRTAHYAGLSRRRKVATGAAVVAALVTILVMVYPGGGASWPPSVATVQSEAAKACQNPDVKSEPGQVNFACAKDTRQILWVFALLTSANNPDFADARTGRLGLEPITPAQGGEVAWSLNLHHPYNPANPIDSLEVAARAINNIIGGATLTRANGKPVVQPGLESEAANCVRYTGSAAVTSHDGFPGRCAKPVTSPAGQAALVADVYQKWVVGAAPETAQDAVVLFENAKNPGDPRVQAILKHLPNSKLLA
jgi:hypothetical protein